jgi:hypothetical protein
MKISEIITEAPRRRGFSKGGGTDRRVTFTNKKLRFLGSPCTQDCSGHMAGYEWSRKHGNAVANSWSPSFNNGTRLKADGK